jgi:hypothetical protein
VEDEGEDDREHDPLLDADRDDDGGRRRGDPELVAITKTTAARTAFGRYCNGFVRNRSTTATTAAVVSCATCVRLCASSAISVFVGLPLTANVLVMPAARLAAESPRRSSSSTKRSR